MNEAPASADLPSPIARNAQWRAFQFIMQSLFCFWLRYRARGLEHLPAEGGALLVINHQSFLDPLLVGLPLTRPVSYLARDNLFRIPIIGWILRNTYVLPINRESASTSSIREAIRRLEHGFYVGIFPEGTRTEDGTVGEFKPGLLALLKRTTVPVIPVGIAGAFEAYPRNAWFPRPGKVRVVYGEPLSAAESAALGKDRDALAVLRDRIISCQEAAEVWRDGNGTDASTASSTLPNRD